MDYNYYYSTCNEGNHENIYKFIIAFNAIAILFNLVLTVARADNGLEKKYINLKKEYDDLDLKHQKDVKDYNELVDHHNLLLKQVQDLEEKNAKDVRDYNELTDSHNELVDTVTELRTEIESKDKRIQRLESRLDRNLDYKDE
jgi:hypothetical protein